MYALRQVGHVVLSGLAGLKSRVEAETWPEGFPEALRGLEGNGVLRAPDGTVLAVEGGKRVWATIPPLTD